MADLNKLTSELAADPESIGYADKSAADRLALLKLKNRSRVIRRAINPQLLNEALGPADAATLMDALEAAAASNPTLKWALQIMYPARGGIMSTDRGILPGSNPDDPSDQGMLYSLSPSIISEPQLTKIMALLIENVDRLTELGIGDVHLGDVEYAGKDVL